MGRGSHTLTPAAASAAAGLASEAARRNITDFSFNALAILGAYGDQKAGAEFGVAWAKFLAKLIPDEHRRPCLNSFFGPNSERKSKKYLMPEADDAKCLQPDLVIKVEQRTPVDYTVVPAWMRQLFKAGGMETNDQQAPHILAAMNHHLRAFNLEHQTTYLLSSHTSTSDDNPVLAVLGGMGPIASADFQKMAVSKAADKDISIWRFDLNLKPQNEFGLDPLVSENFSFWSFLRLLRGVSWTVNNSDNITALVAPSNTFNGVSVPRISKIHGFSLLQNKLINMLYVVTNAVCANANVTDEKIGLLCTTPLKDSNMYQAIFEARGIALHCTTDDEQDNNVQKGIILAKSGEKSGAAALFRTVIESWKRQGIKTIIFGCTEIYKAAKPVLKEFSGINFVDSNKVLADAAVQETLTPGSVLTSNDSTASHLSRFLSLLTRILHCSRYWIKQNPMNAGSSIVLPKGIDAMIKEMTKQTRSKIDLLAELVKIAQVQPSKSIDISPEGLFTAADNVLRHLPQTALFIAKTITAPITQLNKVDSSFTNCDELYKIIILADTNLPKAFTELQDYHRKIAMFDLTENIPRLDSSALNPAGAGAAVPLDHLERVFDSGFMSSHPTRALAAIATPDCTPPANLCKPLATATAKPESGAASADGSTPPSGTFPSCG